MTDPIRPERDTRSAAFDALAEMVRESRTAGTTARPPSAPRLADVEAEERRGRLPASWYRPHAAAKPEVEAALLEAAACGLATGLVAALPLLWLLAGQPAAETALARGGEEAPLLSLIAANSRDVMISTVALAPVARMRALVELARLRILGGDVLAARTLLSRADVARDGDALFLMAETYDPARLAVWGVRTTAGDVERARALYAAANALGHADADDRLAALR